MIKNKTDLLDPTAESRLSDEEKKIVEEAQKTGASSRATESLTETGGSTSGVIGQTIAPEALTQLSKMGGDSDLTGGIANSDENTEAPVEQNEYNR